MGEVCADVCASFFYLKKEDLYEKSGDYYGE